MAAEHLAGFCVCCLLGYIGAALTVPLADEVEAVETALCSDRVMDELISHSAIADVDEFFALGSVG